jgi:hypothetical protein
MMGIIASTMARLFKEYQHPFVCIGQIKLPKSRDGLEKTFRLTLLPLCA